MLLAEATHSDPTQHREREQVPGFYNWNMELDFMPGVSRVVLFVSTAVLPMAMAPYVYLYSSSPESEPQVQVTLWTKTVSRDTALSVKSSLASHLTSLRSGL